jgi:hypothetical protein
MTNYDIYSNEELAKEIFKRLLPYTPSEALELGRERMIELLIEDDEFTTNAKVIPYDHFDY